jgi:polysaccharide chain length determinant protein (PEP-CTERM system associated)
MQESFERVLSQLRSVWRFRWQGLLLAWCLCIAGWAFVYFMPDRYDARARVYIDADSVLRLLIRDLAPQTDMDTKVARVIRELMSRPNMERVATDTDLHLRAKTPEDKENLLDSLTKEISLASMGKNEFEITYSDHDKAMAKRVVQSLLDQFMESTLGAKRTDSTEAQKFIEDQIKEYEKQLAAAEKRLEDFNRENVGLLPSEGKNYYQQLQAEMALLETARISLRETENLRLELLKQVQGEEPTFGFGAQDEGVGDPVLAGYKERIDTMQKKLDELLLVYTEEHPDVVALRSTIKQLEEQRDKEMANRPVTAMPGVEANPVYQQLKIALGQAEADAASKRVRVVEFEKRVHDLQERVDAVPQVESKLAGLNRDYQSVKRTYEQLLQRRESAKLSDSAEQNTTEMKFRIIEPAFVPLQPSGPKRGLFYTALLLVGLVAGLAWGLLRAQIKPTFDNRRILREETGLPVLGCVTMVWTPRELTHRRVGYIGFMGGVAGLSLLFMLLMALEARGLRIYHALAFIKGLVS